jgi:hypothetical protein
VRSAQAECWDHSASTGFVILMLNRRLAQAWFLECTSVSFWEFFSLTMTGHTLALKNSRFGGIEMPKEVKKKGCTSECNCPLFSRHCFQLRGVGGGGWGGDEVLVGARRV